MAPEPDDYQRWRRWRFNQAVERQGVITAAILLLVACAACFSCTGNPY